MMASVIIPVVWLLAMLAAVAFEARPLLRVREVVPALIAFGVTFAIACAVQPQPNWIGMTIAILAAWRLIEPGRPGGDRLLGGACAGLAAALHVAGGISPWMAGGLALCVLVVGAGLVQGRFTRLRPVVLLIVALVAPVAGFALDVAAGWKTGVALGQTAAIASPARVIPVWALIFTGLALLAGAVRGLWTRK